LEQFPEDEKTGALHRNPGRSKRGEKQADWQVVRLCVGGRDPAKMIISKIVTQFHTVLVSDVPNMPVRIPEARRFTWLVDVL
jgi:predicted ATPase